MVESLSQANCTEAEHDPDVLPVWRCQGAITQGEDPGEVFRALYQHYVDLVRVSLYQLNSDAKRLDESVKRSFCKRGKGYPAFAASLPFGLGYTTSWSMWPPRIFFALTGSNYDATGWGVSISAIWCRTEAEQFFA